jgi:hypothetical protein
MVPGVNPPAGMEPEEIARAGARPITPATVCVTDDGASGAPHVWQNRAPAVVSARQDGQAMVIGSYRRVVSPETG